MLKDTFLDITREKSSLRQLTKNYLFHKKIVHEFLQKMGFLLGNLSFGVDCESGRTKSERK